MSAAAPAVTSPHHRPADRPAARDGIAAFVLAATAFALVTGETLPVGLLGQIAADLPAAPSVVGLSVALYAAVAAATAVPLTRLLARWDRRRVLVACAATFALGHLVTALAPTVAVLMAGRCVSAAAHGVYFAVAMPVATRLAAPHRQGRAGSRVAVGGASALVVGTPLVTLVGQAWGWRAAAATVVVASLALAGVLARTLPALPGDRGPGTDGRLAVTLRTAGLPTVLAVTLLAVAGHFAFFTYLAPYADRELGVRDAGLSLVLLCYGIASVAGSAAGGRLADAGPVASVRVAAAAFTVVPAALWLSSRAGATVPGAALLVLSGASFSLLAVLTALAVLRRVDGGRAETASALHSILFQVGILAGSALGSLCARFGAVDVIPLVTAGTGLVVLAVASLAGSAFRARAA
ncbi:MFS transporter [Micromonospora sp. WMMD558]|uniref:MFS transporter n=1 Tax=unclassified Micromonospora TaxID=2617518 RepID=UPI0012B48065|nr:MFS transporter [Micromonospora sp. WMMC415]QGN48675.1 MFS transporter [Micromonospora sp. WMMC415]